MIAISSFVIIISVIFMEKIFTDETTFLLLEEKVPIIEENAKKINIDLDTFFCKKYQNWYIYDGKYYYFKALSSFEILNYLVAEKIGTKYFTLPIVHFIPAKVFNSKGLASLNFRNKEKSYFYGNRKYFSSDSNPIQTLSFLKTFFERDKSYFNLTKDLLRLVAYHIYLSLGDIVYCNLLFQENKDGFSLADVSDLDNAFIDTNINFDASIYYYFSDMFSFAIPSSDFTELITNFPFEEALKIILDINIEQILNSLEKEYFLFISPLYRKYYCKQDQLKKDLVHHLFL